MIPITDAYMKEMLQKTQSYTIIILFKTEKRKDLGADEIVLEHGRRNFELLRDGQLLIVCPINDSTNVSGIGIFSTNADETDKIMQQDPGVKAGIFTYEIHQTRSFPGTSLK